LSTLKADAVTSAQDNTALTLSGTGTGGVKVNDFFVQTKGADIASGTTLTLGKDGNQFDVTGTTTITGIATQGIGSYVTLHFDGVLTFTHHSTNLILPGAANITTAAGDIAVMYEYASADWRCVSYTKANGEAVVSSGGGLTIGSESAAASGTTVDFTGVPSGTQEIYVHFVVVSLYNTASILIQLGDGGGFETSGYESSSAALQNGTAIGLDNNTTGMAIFNSSNSALVCDGFVKLQLQDASDFTWHMSGNCNLGTASDEVVVSAGKKSLSAELTQIRLTNSNGDFDGSGTINVSWR